MSKILEFALSVVDAKQLDGGLVWKDKSTDLHIGRPPRVIVPATYAFNCIYGDSASGVRMQTQKKVTDFFNSPSVGKASRINARPALFELGKKPVVKKAKIFADESDSKQTILDAGQRLGARYCKQCDMLYSTRSKADLKMHERHHNRFTNIGEMRVHSSQLKSWLRKERHYKSQHGCIFRIHADSQSSLKPKVEKVIEDFVNPSVGFCPDLSIWGCDRSRTVWALLFNGLFMHFYDTSRDHSTVEGHYIAGIVITESLRSAQCLSTGEVISDGDPIIGVNRLWTHPTLRRRGLAHEILDQIRKRCYGCPVPRHRVAFSEPTDDGRLFAERYIKSSDGPEKPVLVYTVTD